jgi:ubiquitin C-terminal hydrolase
MGVRIFNTYESGNNCYINAILQVLLRIEPLKDIIQQWKPPFNLDVNEEIVKEIRSLSNQIDSTHRSNRLVLYTGRIRWYLQKKYKVGFDQHDVHEFLLEFIEIFEKVLKPMTIDDDNDDSGGGVSISPIELLFRGTFKNMYTCCSCANTVSKLEDFYILTLSVTEDIIESLEDFITPEHMEYKCEKCHHKQAIKKTVFKRLPDYLIIHLNQFVYKHGTVHKHKSIANVDVNTSIVYLNKNIKYELHSVIIRIGESTELGHFMTAVRDAEGDRYVVFDGEQVREMGNISSPYILVYKLKDLR